MNKIVFLLPTVILLIIASVAHAQQREKIPRIGVVQRRVAPTPSKPDPLAKAFRQGLRELGYIQGKNIQIEHRYGGGSEERVGNLVAELVQLNVDLLVIPTSRGIRAAKQATTTIPIVMLTPMDPVAAGFVDSLARPGANIAGITRLTRDLSGKRLELLKEGVPGVSRVGILTGTTAAAIENFEAAARALKNITVQPLKVRSPRPDLDAAFQAAANGDVNALITLRDAVMTASYVRRIADLAKRNRLPSMNEDSPYVEAGGLMSYGANDADQFRRVAVYVDKILQGANPAELRVEQPLTIPSQQITVLRNLKRDSSEGKLDLRLGLPWTSQLDFTLPYSFIQEESVTGGSSERRRSGLGDIQLGWTKQLLNERAWFPDLLTTFTWNSDTGQRDIGSGFHGIQAGLTAVKRRDPLAFFGSFAHNWSLSGRQLGNDLDPANMVSVRLGTLLATSPDTSLRFALDVSRSGRDKVNGVRVSGSNQTAALFEFGVASAILPRTLLDVRAGIGLTSDSPDFRFGVSLPVRLN